MELRETTWNVLEDAGTSTMKMFPLFQPQPWNNPSPTPATWGPNCPEVSVKGSWWLPNSKYCHYDQHAHWRMPFQERVREAVGEWERSDKQFHVRQNMGSDYWVAMSVRLQLWCLLMGPLCLWQSFLPVWGVLIEILVPTNVRSFSRIVCDLQASKTICRWCAIIQTMDLKYLEVSGVAAITWTCLLQYKQG